MPSTLNELLQEFSQYGSPVRFNQPVAWVLGETGVGAPLNSVRPRISPDPAPKLNSLKSIKKADRLKMRLCEIGEAWDDFQENRQRDAIYGYLRVVFKLVEDCKGKRRTRKLLWRTFKYGGVQFDREADPFATVIRCTCGGALDNKTISKWARALRYVAVRKNPNISLKKFMKKMGGVNKCASRCALLIKKRA